VLAALWANFHAGFLVGLVALAIPVGVEAARRLLRRPADLPLKRLAVTLALASAAALANPYGWRQLYYPLHYALHPEITAQNLEWRPTRLANEPGLVLLLAAAAVFMALAWRSVKLRDAALVVAFSAFALKASRHVGLAAMVVPIAAAPAVAALGRRSIERLRERSKAGLALAAALAMVAAFFALHGPPPADPMRFDDSIAMPVHAADFLERAEPPRPWFHQSAWGGYLMHRFRPEAVVFIDGRNDLYGAAFIEACEDAMAGGPPAIELLDRHGVNTVILAYHPRNARLLSTLLQAGWTCIHLSSDGLPVAVLVRGSDEARPWVARYGRPLVPPGRRQKL
jgi:hypothetical protein